MLVPGNVMDVYGVKNRWQLELKPGAAEMNS
jgi:hypothetical protein